MTCLCAAAKNAQHWRLATQLADALAPTNSAAPAARRAGRICQAPGWFTTTWRDTHVMLHILLPVVIADKCTPHDFIVAANLISTRASDVQSYHLPECILR